MTLKRIPAAASFAALLLAMPAGGLAAQVVNHGAFFGNYPFASTRVFQSAGFSYAAIELRKLKKGKMNEGQWVSRSKNRLVNEVFALAAKNVNKYHGTGYAVDNIRFQIVRDGKHISLYMDYNLIILK